MSGHRGAETGAGAAVITQVGPYTATIQNNNNSEIFMSTYFVVLMECSES